MSNLPDRKIGEFLKGFDQLLGFSPEHPCTTAYALHVSLDRESLASFRAVR